tara:strand:- start:781 stop:1767 length:987 start_codon:yes stop_codon:yes gene_type:complete
MALRDTEPRGKLKLGVVMDPISAIKVEKDTTLALLLAAQKNGLKLFYMESKDLVLHNGELKAYMRSLTVDDDTDNWHQFHNSRKETPDEVSDLDIILMRKDPPFNMDFVYTTQLLEIAEKMGVFVTNRPQAIRDANEKLYATWFPHLCPETLVTKNISDLKNFHGEQKDIIIKPLDGMGGSSIFRVKDRDSNASVIFETMTKQNERFCMAQRFLPEIENGDKRILMVDGEPVPFSLARVPSQGETRGNLAAGGSGVIQELTENDKRICEEIGGVLRERGLLFVGLDVIGNHLTEINVTSPTCLREIEKGTGLKIAEKVVKAAVQKIRP